MKKQSSDVAAKARNSSAGSNIYQNSKITNGTTPMKTQKRRNSTLNSILEVDEPNDYSISHNSPQDDEDAASKRNKDLSKKEKISKKDLMYDEDGNIILPFGYELDKDGN